MLENGVRPCFPYMFYLMKLLSLSSIVWRCPKSRDAGCKFWLLEEEEELRKSRLVRMGLLDSPQLKTPSPNKRKRGEDPMSLVRGSGSRNVIEIKDEDSPASTLAHDGMPLLN